MKSRLPLTTWAVLAVSFLTVSALPANEPFMNFLEGLRDREFHDFAVLYLEQLEGRGDVPPEIKEIIPYEKAIALMNWAELEWDPETQTYDLARELLEQFVKASPTHEKAAVAKTELASVLIGKAKVMLTLARSPNNVARKVEVQKRARGFIGEARKVFQADHDQCEAVYRAFPVFIDKLKERAKHGARERAKGNLIQAQLNLAMATYEEAQTYDNMSPEWRTKLTEASTEFESIYSKNRSQFAGLYAGMWQGKCCEEMGDITKALSIYKQLTNSCGGPTPRK